MSIEPKDRFKMVVGVHLVLRDGKKFLLGKRQNTGWSDGMYHLFGGHVEDQELVSNAVAREGLEELGIKIDSKDLQLAHVRNILNPDHSRLHLYFVIDHWQGQVVIQEPELCSELAWFETSKLPENITKDASETLRMIDKKKFFYETNVNE